MIKGINDHRISLTTDANTMRGLDKDALKQKIRYAIVGKIIIFTVLPSALKSEYIITIDVNPIR